ncbi:MAG: Rieske 2Fe-2S domain-containing protein [Comamonadaceae bacterium]|nr:Rieske 2Fe-2S domain-containing protein [Comamonadaceae bacterium]
MDLQDRIAALIGDRTDEGWFDVHRDVFRDPSIFQLELQHIFEGTWVFVGLESQVPRAHDFLTTWIGRTPVVVTRAGDGQLHCVINSCRHRGAALFQTRQGNRKFHACPYHGWVYDSGGKCIDIKDQSRGGYPAAFDCLDHNLVPVARFGNYRGFLFASLRQDVPDLLEHLGDARRFLDLVVDQSEEGVEIVPGEVVYTYQGNWKMQVENALDLYHFTSTHPSYLQVLQQRGRRRQQDGAGTPGAQSIYENLGAQRQAQRGSMSFVHGHVAYWGDNPNAAERPLYAGYEPLVQRVGREVADWMLRVRNLVIYPNLQIVENASLQMRVLRPLAVDRTEVTSYCLAPRHEPAQAREKRIRQYEEFYNPSGMATPDDVAVYEACQRGHGARGLSDQQGYLRGLGLGAVAPGQGARELGISPVSAMQGGYDLADETCFHAGYREWQRLMLKGVEHA